MDEKLRLSRSDLNRAFQKQLDKRTAAPKPTAEKASAHLSVVTAAAPAAAVAGSFDGFFEAWEKYYPQIVSLLGWASWFIPGKAVTVIKALLAVVNNQIIPILRQMAQ